MAIEPIKGFYVHDEETDTDGIAKFSSEELEDIRVGSDGVTYDTAGDAVRKQVKTVHDLINLLNSFVGLRDYGLLAGYTFEQINFQTQAPVTVTDTANGVNLSKPNWYNVLCQFAFTSVSKAGRYQVEITAESDRAMTVNNYINGTVSGTEKQITNGALTYEFDYTGGTWKVGITIPGAQTEPFNLSINFYLIADIYTLIENLESAPAIIGDYNTFYGVNAGSNTNEQGTGDNGKYNTGFGRNAMRDNTDGDHNTAFGYCALSKNTTGDLNTAVGEDALYQNQEGYCNTAIGVHALQNSIGIANTAIGEDVARYLTDGDANIFIGSQCGNGVNHGNGNIMLGYYNSTSDCDYDNTIVIGREVSPSQSNEIRIGKTTHNKVVIAGKVITFNNDGTITWSNES